MNAVSLTARGKEPVRATLIYGAGDVRVEDVPDPVVREPSDATSPSDIARWPTARP